MSPTARKAKSAKTFTPTTGGPEPLDAIFTHIKTEFENRILANGHSAMLSYTRSGRPVALVHQHIGDLLVAAGINAANVQFERTIKTQFGNKRQDVVAVPGGRTMPTGNSTLSVAVKAQLYGIQKNRDNNFSIVRAELLALHEEHPQIVLGNVAVVAVMEWVGKEAKNKRVAYKKLSPKTLSQIIESFAKVSGRNPAAPLTPQGSPGNAERVGLIIVDYSKNPAVIYDSVADLERDGFLPQGSGLSLAGLTMLDFATDLLAEHHSRFRGADRL